MSLKEELGMAVKGVLFAVFVTFIATLALGTILTLMMIWLEVAAR